MDQQKLNEVNDIARTITPDIYQYLALELNSYCWTKEEERDFRNLLNRMSTNLNTLGPIINSPDYGDYLKANVNQDIEKIKSTFKATKESIETWNKIFAALDKGKNSYSEIQESLRIVLYLDSKKNLTLDQKITLEKHRSAYNEARDKIFLSFRDEVRDLPGIEWHRIESSLESSSIKQLYQCDKGTV